MLSTALLRGSSVCARVGRANASEVDEDERALSKVQVRVQFYCAPCGNLGLGIGFPARHAAVLPRQVIGHREPRMRLSEIRMKLDGSG